MDTQREQASVTGGLEFVRVGKALIIDHAVCLEGKPEHGLGNMWITAEETEKLFSGANVRVYQFRIDPEIDNDVEFIRVGIGHVSKSGKAFLVGYCRSETFRLLSIPTAQLKDVMAGRRSAALMSEMVIVPAVADTVQATLAVVC